MKRTASRPALIAASAAVAFSVALTGCSDKGTTTSSETTASAGNSETDAPALLKSASDASKALEAVHFTGAVKGKVPNLPITKIDGDLNIKPTVSAKGTATIDMGGTSEAKFTYVSGTMYAAILGDKYVDYGDGKSVYDVASLFDSTKGIPNILTKMTGVKSEGEETVGGEKATKISGTVPATDISAISGSRVDPNKSVPVPTTVWVKSSGDKQLVQIQVTPAEKSTVTLTFSKWGDKTTVTKPAVATVEPTDKPEAGESVGR